MLSVQERERTFFNWCFTRAPPRVLAEAGFFSLGAALFKFVFSWCFRFHLLHFHKTCHYYAFETKSLSSVYVTCSVIEQLLYVCSKSRKICLLKKWGSAKQRTVH